MDAVNTNGVTVDGKQKDQVREPITLHTVTSNTDGQDGRARSNSAYVPLNRHPYCQSESRREILKSSGQLIKVPPNELDRPHVFHVDFTVEEAHKLQLVALRVAPRLGIESVKKNKNPVRGLAKLMGKLGRREIEALSCELETETRTPTDIANFLHDCCRGKARTQDSCVFSIEKDVTSQRGDALHDSRVSLLLIAREVTGNRSTTTGMRDFTNEFRKSLEDSLELRSEFTNCAGDIYAVSWVSDSAFIVGTTAHMDSHNQQYNKPGNLLLGSIAPALTKLKSYPNHRIPRPIVEKGENATVGMRESQDPWLYTSVVSSDYDPIHDRTYTCGFDRRTKIWQVEKSGLSMLCVGTWMHDGSVNFVQASQMAHPKGLVATAADVMTDAVRIYEINPEDISNSTYTSFSTTKVPTSRSLSPKWAYFPSTMKWGLEESVRHLLLVGFSPRSLSNYDDDIPERSLSAGELCLWDSVTQHAVQIAGVNSQNVLEVQWHPHRPEFIAAVSLSGKLDANVRTQVRIFVREIAPLYGIRFKCTISFDCPALSVNTLTIMPNSPASFYITAGCTDGKTYVWYSAQTDSLLRRPIHVLAHGPPLEGIAVGDNEEDTGVMFTAQGASVGRFYTGSSDGMVKVWNIHAKEPKGRVILEAPAPISHGAFSHDYSKLVIGDASGRVFIFSINEDDDKPAPYVNLPGPPGMRATTWRTPTPIAHHQEPPPPPQMPQGLKTGCELGRAYITARQLKFSGDPTVGMVQDVNYADTGLFRPDAHVECEPTRKLIEHVESKQQIKRKVLDNVPIRTKRVKIIGASNEDADHVDADGEEPKTRDVAKRHDENRKLDLDLQGLSLETRNALDRDRVPLQELCDDVEYCGLEYIDEVDENLKKGVVKQEEEDN